MIPTWLKRFSAMPILWWMWGRLFRRWKRLRPGFMSPLTRIFLHSQSVSQSVETLLDQLEQGLEQTDRFSQEMSDLVMDMLLVSVEYTAYFFEKTVRDLALSYHREIEFTLEGGRHQVDRSLLAGIKEPVYHLLRNSVIHGVELPEEREARGKPRQARIRLALKKFGELLEILCEDDGRGLDPEKIKLTAVKKNLVDAGAVEGLSDREVMHLIFESGFSSAETVTELAGRGGRPGCGQKYG